MTVWVHVSKRGILTGDKVGFPDRVVAGSYVQQMRDARDIDPAFIKFRHGGYDWKILPESAGAE